MSSLFDDLEDETQPSMGLEIGTALSDVIKEIGKNNDRLAATLAKAMVDAMHAVESKEIIIKQSEGKQVSKWKFKVTRDDKGFMSDVIVTAEEWK